MLHNPFPAAFGNDRPTLAVRERFDLNTLANDRFQSPRARKRAAALLMLAEGGDTETVHRCTGVAPQAQQEMLSRFAAHGLHAAVFGSPRRSEQRRYNIKATVLVLNDLLASRPPAGALSWSLVTLTDGVRQRVPGAEAITRETVREILKKEMGIASVRYLDPYWLIQLKRR